MTNPSQPPNPVAHEATYITEGGIETYMMYKKGYELRNFCLFELMDDAKAMADLRDYHVQIIEVALKHRIGAILDGVHYRTSRDWGELLGYSRGGLADIVTRGIEFYRELADEFASPDCPMPVSGVVGPRGDAYATGHTMNADESQEYHFDQVETMKAAGADFVTALTFTSAYEAIGVARVCEAANMPVVVSFTLGSDGNLKTGSSLADAIAKVDSSTDAKPAYYMINCAHPVDFAAALDVEGDWVSRLGGIRANASSLEHGTLCQLGRLDEGDPVELGQQMGTVSARFPHLSVWGGCCGTDAEHIDQIVQNVLPARIAVAS